MIGLPRDLAASRRSPQSRIHRRYSWTPTLALPICACCMTMLVGGCQGESARPENAQRREAAHLSLPASALQETPTETQAVPTTLSANANSANQPHPQQEDSFAEQVDKVRQGASDTIEINEAIISDDQLERLRGLSGLKVFILNQGSITDVGVQSLQDCRQLKRIRLRNSPITGVGLEHLASLPDLQWLNLPDAKLDNTSLQALQRMPQLEMLRLGSPGVDDTGIAPLRNHPRLRFVHLIDIPVTDLSLDVFGSLPKLESLYLDGAQISDAGWVAWFRTHRQVHVHLDQFHHDRDPGKH